MASVLVTVDESRFDEVSRAAQNAGLTILQSYAGGVLVGEVSDDKRQAVKSVDGVLSVEDEPEMRIPEDWD